MKLSLAVINLGRAGGKAIYSMEECAVWFEVAIVASIFAVGNTLFGLFEEGVPRWKRVLKFFLYVLVTVLLSAIAGRIWAFAWIACGLTFATVVHLWWLPKHGINGWTAEPKEKYYELRGWKT